MHEALKRHLGRVEAPAELWDRVQAARPLADTRGSVIWPMAACAAMLLMSVVGWSMWKASARPVEIHSANANEVRAWVLANSGLNVPLPAKPASLVEIVSARIDQAVATISYRVGEIKATLQVAKTSSDDTPHTGNTSSTWTRGGQSYTLAVADPGDLKKACVLCHDAPTAALY